MKYVTFIFSTCLLISFCSFSQNVNELTLEDFKNSKFENESEFTDDNGETYKFRKTDTQMGMYIKTNGTWKRHGAWYYMFSTGGLRRSEVFSCGKLNGLTESYYASGELNFKIPFVDGKKHGIQYQYRKNHSLICERSYVQGKKHGTEMRYDSDGNFTTKIQWNNNVKIE